MAATLEQFKAALIVAGGKEIAEEEAVEKKDGILARVLHRLGKRASESASDKLDIYDATEVVDEHSRYNETIIHRHTERMARFAVPVTRRIKTQRLLGMIGVESIDTYTLSKADGSQWVQVALGHDKSTRQHFAMQQLLDEAPISGGIVVPNRDVLQTALTGEIPGGEAQAKL